MKSNQFTIVFVAPFGLGQKTTVWARILPLAQELVTLGHRVYILIPPWDTPEDAGKTWTEQGVVIEHVVISGGLPATLWRMIQRIDQIQPDIVHIVKPRAHAGMVQWWLWMRRKVTGQYIPNHLREMTLNAEAQPSNLRHRPKVVLDIDDWEQAWADINPYPWPVARFLAWQEEWGIRHADGITAASQWLTQRAERYNAQKPVPVVYLPNGITPVDAANNSVAEGEQPTLNILYFTRFIEVNPEWLADFWVALTRAYTNTVSDAPKQLQLLVVGSAFQEGREALFAEIMQQTGNASQQVSWLGYVPSTELPALYKTVSCAIFPSAQTPLLQAKCSVKLATTLLHGVPVVASAVGEQSNYGAEQSATLVDAEATPARFAEAVLDVIHHPQTQQQLVRNAQKRLYNTYQWSMLGRRLHYFYLQLG